VALQELDATFGNLKLESNKQEIVEHVAFHPFGEFAWLQDRLNDIDRYLFRAYDKRSDGSNDEIRVKSRDAKRSSRNAERDMFSRTDHTNVAALLNRYLRWISGRHFGDNMAPGRALYSLPCSIPSTDMSSTERH
jgi:hypothetical protein